MLNAAWPIFFKISQITSALSLRSFIFQVHWAAVPLYTCQPNLPHPFQRKSISNRSDNRLLVPYSHSPFVQTLKLDLTVKHSTLGVQFGCLKDGRFCYLTYFNASWLQLLPQVMVWHKLYREEGLRKWLSHHTSHQIPRSPKHHGKVAVITFSTDSQLE